MTKSPDKDRPADPLGNIPRYAIFRNHKVRIVSYEDNKFRILDTNDHIISVRRSQLRFLPEKSKN